MSKVPRFAGERLIAWAQTPIGEEVLEGTLGGLLAGVPIAIQGDTDPRAAALTTAAAIAGGIGMGMAGRRIGAWAGRRAHAAPLPDQTGAMATIGRIGGQETIGKALEENGKMLRSQIADYLVEKQASKMLLEGKVSPEQMEQLMALRKVQGISDAISNAPPALRNQLEAALQADQATLQQALNDPTARAQMLRVTGIDADSLRAVEEQLTREAGASMGTSLNRLADNLQDTEAIKQIPLLTPELLRNVASNEVTPISGEHVGRAVGRFLGDEIGVLGGVGVGLAASTALGFESPKDRRIRELQEQLAGR